MDDYYVYLYLDPRKSGQYIYENFSLLYEPFYVGKGKDDRRKDLNRGRSDYFINKINKIKELGFEPIVIKINENLFETEAFELEIKLIKLIGRKDLDEGLLVNLTDGGEGSSGYKHTDETKEKMRTDFSIIKSSFRDKGYKLLSSSDEYINNETKLKYECVKGHYCEMSWSSFKQDKECPYCKRVKIDFEDIIKAFEDKHYTLSSKKYEYINCYTKLKYICDKGHLHETCWNNFQQGYECPYCKKLKIDFKNILSSFRDKGYKLLSSSDEYINCYTKLKYICDKGHYHEITWNSFQQNHFCPYCDKDKKREIYYYKIVKLFEYFGYDLLTQFYEYENCNQKLKYITLDGKYKYISAKYLQHKLSIKGLKLEDIINEL